MGDLLLAYRGGDLYIDRADPTILISLHAVQNTPTRYLRIRGGELHITAKNGAVTYVIAGWDHRHQALICRRTSPWPAADG